MTDRILILPEETVIDGEVTHPKQITIVLPNGEGICIAEAVEILSKKKKPKKESKFKRFRRAFKQAYADSEHEYDDVQEDMFNHR
jgi:gamma-glutamyltranspeptidase